MDSRRSASMESYWVPGVNDLGTMGRSAFAEAHETYWIESDFEAKVAEGVRPDGRVGRNRAHRLPWLSPTRR